MFLLSLLSLCFADNYQYWGHWETTPDIVVCQSADIDIKDVRSAVDYWESRGYDIGNILIWKKCDRSKYKNTIKITPPGSYINLKKHFAYTSVRTIGENDDIMSSSLIEITKEGTSHKEVIIHEMGHALGIKHTSEKSDIMYHMHVYEHTNF